MVTVYAAMEDAVFIAAEKSMGWAASEHLEGHQPECITVTPDSSSTVYCGTFDAGLQRSTDGGHSWTRVGAETLPDAVMSLAIDPHDHDVVWAGTEPSAVYRSGDRGQTWTHKQGLTDLPSADEWFFPPRPETHHVRWIEPDPNEAGRLYVGIEAGALVITPDAGETWVERPPGARRDNHSLATHPGAPGHVYAAAGDGYAESTDNGQSWDHPQDGLSHRYCWSVVLDPTDPETIFLSGARGPRQAHTSTTAESYVYQRTRPETDWQRIDELPSGTGVTRAVFATGPDDDSIYVGSNQGLFHTTSSGDSWQRLETGWPDRFGEHTVRGLTVGK